MASPDRRVEAVWVRDSGGGATVSTSYKLFIVPTGGTPTRGHELLLAEKVSNLQITWREPKRLEVSYDKAREYTASSITGRIGILTTFDMSSKSDSSTEAVPIAPVAARFNPRGPKGK